MAPAIIPEAFHVPSLPATYLARPRLDALWAERGEASLVLVTAGAGYGKSCFLAAQARANPSAHRWLRVEDGGACLEAFVADLCALLDVPAPSRLAGPAEADSPLSREALAVILAALRSRGRTVLVIDDAHLLQASPPVLRFLESLVRCLPERATLVLSSREPFGLGTTRSRTQGRVTAFTSRDLEFRAEEVTALFALRFGGVHLDERRCRRVLAATEGWAAGLEIFLQALESPLPAAIDRALAQLHSAGSAWFDYFAEEVVARLDEDARDFLRRSAVLPQLVPRVCDRVLGRTDSGRLLEEQARRNLFTLRDESSGEVYRHHHLFRRFLRAWLERQTPPDDLRALRRRAARILLAEDETADALMLLADSGDVEATLRLIERRSQELVRTGRYDALEHALQAIPDSLARRSPRALFVRARLCDDRGRWEEAEAIYARILRLRPAAALRVEVLGILAQLVSRRGEYARAVALCRRALAVRVKGGGAHHRLLATLGVAACELGRIEEGRRHLEQARALCVRREDANGAAQVDYLLAANVYLATGEFALGREAARRALARLRALRDPRKVCVCLGVLAWVSVLAGEVAEARDLATESQRLAESLDLQPALTMALHVLGRCAALEGDFAQARRCLEEGIRIGDALGESDARILPRLILAECALATGAAVEARARGEEALAIAMEMHDVLQQAQARVILGLVAAGASARNARPHWAHAERDLRRLGASFDLHRLLLLRLATEELAPASRRRLLEELLAGVARCGHERLILAWEPVRGARVLATALRNPVEPPGAASLLARLGPAAIPELLALARDPDDQARLRAVKLLAEIGGPRARTALVRAARGARTRPSGARAEEELARAPRLPLGISALGAMRVSHGEVEITAENWRSARARRLFQFLLVREFRWVPADEVIDALWPEADPEKARGSLWQSVYQLRRTLEPALAEPRASRYVRAEEPGYRLEPGEGYAYDAEDLEEAVRNADRLAAAGRARAAEPPYRRALDLYKGEFLAEFPYEEFLAPAREHLRELHLRACSRLAALRAAAHAWAEVVPLCRRSLREDPYREEQHLLLIEALASLGNRREALDAWRDFEARITGELGLPSSPRALALAERVRGAK
jgi:LuxR family transcriptional regulator, maltose regulon positive regulatory protein